MHFMKRILFALAFVFALASAFTTKIQKTNLLLSPYYFNGSGNCVSGVLNAPPFGTCDVRMSGNFCTVTDGNRDAYHGAGNCGVITKEIRYE